MKGAIMLVVLLMFAPAPFLQPTIDSIKPGAYTIEVWGVYYGLTLHEDGRCTWHHYPSLCIATGHWRCYGKPAMLTITQRGWYTKGLTLEGTRTKNRDEWFGMRWIGNESNTSHFYLYQKVKNGH